jgi:hypothetical protein
MNTLFIPGVSQSEFEWIHANKKLIANRLHLTKDEHSFVHRLARHSLALIHKALSGEIIEATRAYLTTCLNTHFAARYVQGVFDHISKLNSAMSFIIGREGFRTKGAHTVEWPGILYQRESSGKAPGGKKPAFIAGR